MGLNSLIPQRANKLTPAADKDNVFYIEVHKIRPNPSQPRHEFDQQGLEELAASIKKYGMLQPILVTKVENETDRGIEVDYEVIAGERRLRAAKILGLPQIPVIIKSDFDEDHIKLEVALIENLQRENLNPLEEAEAYVRLTSEFNMSQEAVAQKVSKSREAISNTMRLLDLPRVMQLALRDGRLSRSHARALLAFKDDPMKQREMFQRVLLGNITTSDVEKAGQQYKQVQRGEIPAPPVRFAELETNLNKNLMSKNLATAVLIKTSNRGGSGSIQIKFASLEQLNAIAKILLD